MMLLSCSSHSSGVAVLLITLSWVVVSQGCHHRYHCLLLLQVVAMATLSVLTGSLRQDASRPHGVSQSHSPGVALRPMEAEGPGRGGLVCTLQVRIEMSTDNCQQFSVDDSVILLCLAERARQRLNFHQFL